MVYVKKVLFLFIFWGWGAVLKEYEERKINKLRDGTPKP
jgi:hypothetical protein